MREFFNQENHEPDPEMQKKITELTEGVQHHGRVLDDMEDHSELPRDEQSSPNG